MTDFDRGRRRVERLSLGFAPPCPLRRCFPCSRLSREARARVPRAAAPGADARGAARGEPLPPVRQADPGFPRVCVIADTRVHSPSLTAERLPAVKFVRKEIVGLHRSEQMPGAACSEACSQAEIVEARADASVTKHWQVDRAAREASHDGTLVGVREQQVIQQHRVDHVTVTWHR